MKIGILTWAKVVNHGAVLQCYSSQQVLKELGNDPVVLNYVGNKNGQQMTFRYRLKHANNKVSPAAIKIRFKLPKWAKEKKELFTQFISEYINFGDYYNVDQNLEAAYIGSDMVFDFFEGYNPFMYGKDVIAPYVFSYAACFGHVTETMFNSFSERKTIYKYLNKMDGIAYRDENTAKILKNCCDINDAVRTIDPVLLYGFDKEKKLWDSGKWKKRNYILIYSYTYNMDKNNEIKAIKKLAKNKNLDIVSVGYMHNWCDECINADPKEFVELFYNASYVITDTFHGTVFSIIFEKQFCSVLRNNAFKVKDLLKQLNLDSRLDSSLEKEINLMENNPINYEVVNKILNQQRINSMNYIKSQLHKAEVKHD